MEYELRGTECKEFVELIQSQAVEIRSGCLAIITRDCDGNGIDAYGPSISFCPYCGAKIIAEHNKEHGYWDWWHE